jgi:hypothetical protein
MSKPLIILDLFYIKWNSQFGKQLMNLCQNHSSDLIISLLFPKEAQNNFHKSSKIESLCEPFLQEKQTRFIQNDVDLGITIGRAIESSVYKSKKEFVYIFTNRIKYFGSCYQNDFTLIEINQLDDFLNYSFSSIIEQDHQIQNLILEEKISKNIPKHFFANNVHRDLLPAEVSCLNELCKSLVHSIAKGNNIPTTLGSLTNICLDICQTHSKTTFISDVQDFACIFVKRLFIEGIFKNNKILLLMKLGHLSNLSQMTDLQKIEKTEKLTETLTKIKATIKEAPFESIGDTETVREIIEKEEGKRQYQLKSETKQHEHPAFPQEAGENYYKKAKELQNPFFEKREEKEGFGEHEMKEAQNYKKQLGEGESKAQMHAFLPSHLLHQTHTEAQAQAQAEGKQATNPFPLTCTTTHSKSFTHNAPPHFPLSSTQAQAQTLSLSFTQNPPPSNSSQNQYHNSQFPNFPLSQQPLSNPPINNNNNFQNNIPLSKSSMNKNSKPFYPPRLQSFQPQQQLQQVQQVQQIQQIDLNASSSDTFSTSTNASYNMLSVSSASAAAKHDDLMKEDVRELCMNDKIIVYIVKTLSENYLDKCIRSGWTKITKLKALRNLFLNFIKQFNPKVDRFSKADVRNIIESEDYQEVILLNIILQLISHNFISITGTTVVSKEDVIQSSDGLRIVHQSLELNRTKVERKFKESTSAINVKRATLAFEKITDIFMNKIIEKKLLYPKNMKELFVTIKKQVSESAREEVINPECNIEDVTHRTMMNLFENSIVSCDKIQDYNQIAYIKNQGAKINFSLYPF